MALSTDHLSDPVQWMALFEESGRKYQLDVTVSTGDFSNSVSFLKEKLIMVTISDKVGVEPHLISFKNRAKGFLKIVAEVMTNVANHFDVDVYVASKSGMQRNEMIRRRVRLATDEELAAGRPRYISEREPLNPQDLWEEFQLEPTAQLASPRRRPPHVLIAFRESF